MTAHSARPAHPIRLIALDLDGTLLRSDRTIGPRTLQALRAAHAKGVQIVLASGRMTPAMEDAATQLGLDVYLLSYNGAAVCSPRAQGRKRLFHQPLNAALAGELIRYAKERRYQVNFYHEDVIVSEDAPHLRPWVELYRTRTGSPYRFVEKLDEVLAHAPTKLLYVVDPESRNQAHDELCQRYGHLATIVKSEPEYLEFLDAEVDKGKSIGRLAGMLGLELTGIMAMGDAENDVSMLKAAAWGVAVANAGPRAREAAKAITENDHNHDAVAEAVERWVL